MYEYKFDPFGVHCWYLHAEANQKHHHKVEAFTNGRDCSAIMYFSMNSISKIQISMNVVGKLFTQIAIQLCSVWSIYKQKPENIFKIARKNDLFMKKSLTSRMEIVWVEKKEETSTSKHLPIV